ncbi:MAG: rhomboid family intramembrane serine protease [Waddliaceae bacterium]
MIHGAQQPVQHAQPAWLEDFQKAPVTYTLMGTCAAVHIISGLARSTFLYYGALQVQRVMQGEVWRVATHAFLHSSVLHLGLNLFSLYIYRDVESRIGSLGVVATTVAALAFTLLAEIAFTNWHVRSLGISGVCFALRGVKVGIEGGNVCEIAQRALKHICEQPFEILGYIGLSALGVRIGHLAHLSGFLAGVVVGRFYAG